MLTLDKPLTESYGIESAYRTLYFVKVAGQICLMPAAHIDRVQKSLAEAEKPFAKDSYETMFLYRRPKPTPKKVEDE